MKRIILILAMMLMSIVASAQIGDVKVGEPTKTLANLRSGFCKLQCNGLDYFLTITSDNRFDDPAIIHIGAGQDSARKTLYDLIDLIEQMKKKSSASFTTIRGLYKYTIYKYTRSVVMFSDLPGIAGIVSVSTDELYDMAGKVE